MKNKYLLALIQKIKNEPFPANGRGGKTRWMIRQAICEMLDGQPYIMIISHNKLSEENIKEKFFTQCSKFGLVLEEKCGYYEWGGSEVRFSTIKEEEELLGFRGSFYEDHFIHGH